MSSEIKDAKTVGDITDRLCEAEGFARGLWEAIKGRAELIGDEPDGLYALADVLAERLKQINERLTEINKGGIEAPSSGVAAAKTDGAYSLDDMDSDVYHLHELLGAACEELQDAYPSDDTNQKAHLDRAVALVAVCRDITECIEKRREAGA